MYRWIMRCLVATQNIITIGGFLKGFQFSCFRFLILHKVLEPNQLGSLQGAEGGSPAQQGPGVPEARARPLPARLASAGGRGRRSSPVCRPRPRCSAEERPRCWRRSPRRSPHRCCCPPSRWRPPSRRPRRPRRPGPCSGGRGSPPAGPSSTWRTTWSCRRCRLASGPEASWPTRAAPAGAATREWRPPALAAHWSARHVHRL